MPTSDDRALRGGLELRKLCGTDHLMFRDHLVRLDLNTRRLRFGTAVNDRFLAQYAERALSPDAAVFGCIVEGTLRGTGELRPLYDSWPVAAEAAFAVEAPWQNRGIGHALMERVIATARHRAVKVVHLICLAENARMRHLVEAFRDEIEADTEATRVTLAAARSGEASEDGGDFIRAALSVGPITPR
jgi:GNAT superfamily N-acetyltransferase